MSIDNIGWHNVHEFLPREDGGYLLQRFPASVRDDLGLSRIGRLFTSRSSNGCELRVISNAERLRVSLSTLAETAKVQVFRGDFPVGGGLHMLEQGRTTHILLDRISYDSKTDSAIAQSRFSPEMWRIYCFDAPIIFHEIDACGETFRVPNADEQPAMKWLAYGSSITQSGQSYEGYVNTTAILLGAEVFNQGMGGSCWLEPSVAEFIAQRQDWDFCTLEIGINMQGTFTAEQFEERARPFIETIAKAHPDKPVAVLSVFTNGNDHAKDPENRYALANRQFREIAEAIVTEYHLPNLHFIDGREIFVDLRGFSADLLHPTPIAAVRAGEKLAGRLKAILENGVNSHH